MSENGKERLCIALKQKQTQKDEWKEQNTNVIWQQLVFEFDV